MTRRTAMVVLLAGAAAVVSGAIWQANLKPSARSYDPELVVTGVPDTQGQPLVAQRYEITVAEWNMCFDAGACALQLSVRRKGREADYPATGVNWLDVQEYLTWINAQSRKTYRLPTRAEWMALAQDVLPEPAKPLFDDPLLDWANSYSMKPATPRALKPSGSFSVAASGLSDLDGSVWEWTSDCYDPEFSADRCPAFHVGGEHIAAIPIFTRDPARGGCAVGTPPAHLGLRLVLAG